MTIRIREKTPFECRIDFYIILYIGILIKFENNIKKHFRWG